MLSPARGAEVILELKKGMIDNQGKIDTIAPSDGIASRIIGKVNQNLGERGVLTPRWILPGR
jgi:hypothetical protein